MNVRLYAGLCDLVGASEVGVDVPAEATATDLLMHLQAKYPSAAALLKRSTVAVDREYRTGSERIASTEVAVLPPVSGG